MGKSFQTFHFPFFSFNSRRSKKRENKRIQLTGYLRIKGNKNKEDIKH